ncbi:calcium-transporting ATPase 1 [Myxozyma melibiosi]|uniref:Calcium-transporting ATPase n=1 Tax=Myxozyma melibiosi TaxID=54550 RepID=A0ABR1F130_9ASCO
MDPPQSAAPTTSPSVAFCAISIEDTALRLGTSLARGLESLQDAAYRRSVHGPNELSDDTKDSLLKRFAQQFYENPLILLLLGSAGLSFFMGNLDDAISITIAILIVVTVGFVQEYRSEKSLEALTRLVPHHANLVRGDAVLQVPAASLVPGDLVSFSVGDRIPADVRITTAVHLQIDESSLTGENRPVTKTAEPVDDSRWPAPSVIPVNERHSCAFMGTLVRDGRGSGVVIGTGKATEFGNVFTMMASIAKPKTPLQQSMDKLGKDLSYLSFGVIGCICLIGVFQGRSWLEMFTIGVSLAVAAIPEGLPIIVTVTLALGVLRMAKRRAIMRRLPSVETLGCVNVICSDKTGTLTMNHLTVTEIWTVDMNEPLVVSEGSSAEANLAMKNSLIIGSNCNNSVYVQQDHKLHGPPTDIALTEVIDKFGMEDPRPTRERIHETPFSSARKWMGVSSKAVGATGGSGAIHVKGGYDVVINFCDTIMNAQGKTVPLDAGMRKKVMDAAEKLARRGLRVLAFALGSGDSTENPANLALCGLMGMYDPPRPNVSKSIWRLAQGGVRVIMITGDSEVTAASIATSIGIPLYGASANDRAIMRGEKIEHMTETELQDEMSTVTVFARTSPEHKMKIIRALQAKGDVVAMTGDGVNDAPALKMADIGISMGLMGTDVANEAADMILTDDDFSTILAAIEEGKAIFSNIQNFLTFQLSTSIAALSLVAVATTIGLPNPLNAMQILWINILMDGPPAQSLGVEPVDPEIMSRPPRRRDDKILTAKLFKRTVMSAAVIFLGTMFVYILEMTDGKVTKRDTTMTFTCFVLFDMFNALGCRSESKSIFELGVASNRIFNLAVGGSLLGQLAVIYLPFLQRVFQTEALSLKDLLMLTVIASTVLIVDEARKYLRKSKFLSGYSLNV